jgi:phospholipid/cholesterol/gamma-HCH transport system substrate-binding protein
MADERTERRRNLQVGLFVLAALFVAVLMFWLVGSKQRLFGRTYPLETWFSDVSGLRAGAPVRLAGMDVGTVTAVVFTQNLENKQVQILLEIDRRYAQRIRGDSVATVATQGLLGDKYVSVSVGSPAHPELEPGGTLAHVEPQNIFAAVETGTEVIDNLKSITEEIDVMIRGEEGETAQRSLQDIVASVRNLLNETEQGRGILHELIYDRELPRKIDSLVDNLESASGDLKEVTQVLTEGDGTLHQLLYDGKAADAIDRIEAMATEMEALLKDARSEQGLLYALLYDSDRVKLIDNLEAATVDLRNVVEGIKQGQGTLGGLVADPTIYQDIKALLGRAERNRILKAYVRRTVRESERAAGLDEGGGEVRE